MIEILKYIFSSFWVFIGTLIIIYAILHLISITINNVLKTIIALNMSKQGKTTEEINTLLSDKEGDK